MSAHALRVDQAASGARALSAAPGGPPVRVLHVFGTMNRGGAETRTLEIMRRVHGASHHFDFCVLGGRRGAYDADIERLGGRVVFCPLGRNPIAFARRLHRLLSRGQYDVLHSHVHQFSAVVLLIGWLAGVSVRIAHLRNVHDGRPARILRRGYRFAMRRLLDATATTVVGVSESVMDAFFGPRWRDDPRRRVVYNGVDVREPDGGSARAVRAELDVPAGARVVIHVGRFAPAKNHAALVDIGARLLADRADVVLVLVGDGPLRPAIERRVAEQGLASRVRFTGERADVARLLRAADAFAFPSLWEGLPGVVLEALAAGLQVVANPIGPVQEIARYASGVTLSDPARPDDFAQALAEALDEGRSPVSRLPARFTLEASMEEMLACYR